MTTTEPSLEIDELKSSGPLWSVKSRVSWGALMAGTVVAIVAYSLMTLLGTALALNISDGATAKELATFAGVWSYVTLILAMFLGGYISTLYTVGEFRYEAFLYGVIVWGVASLVLIPLASLSVGSSVGTVLASHGLAKMSSVTEPLIVGAQEKFSNMGRRGEDLVADLGRKLSSAAKEKTSTSSDQSNSDSQSSSSDNQSSNKSSSDKSNSDSKDTSSADNSSADKNTDKNTASTSTSSSSDSSQDARQDNSNEDRTISKETKSKLTAGAWYAFGGTLISVLAAVFGASIGPTFHIKHYKVPLRRTTVVPVVPAPRLNQHRVDSD